MQPGKFSETTTSGNSPASVSSVYDVENGTCERVSATTVASARSPGQPFDATTSITTLQSKVRQTLAVISGLTYVVDDSEFLENQCRQLQEKVKEFRSKSSVTAKHTVFRCSRRTVKSSIRGSALRRRLALIRARRRTRLRQRRLRKSQLSGSEFMFLLAVYVLLVAKRDAYSSRLDIYA